MANVKLKILLISCADSRPGAIERILVRPRRLHAMQESLPAGWERITLEFDDRHHGAVRFVPLRGHHLISSSFRPFFFSAAILARLLFHLETRILYDRPLSHCPSLEKTLIGPTTDRFAGIANEIVTPTDFYRDSRSIRPPSSRIPSVGFIGTPLKTMERTFLPRSWKIAGANLLVQIVAGE